MGRYGRGGLARQTNFDESRRAGGPEWRQEPASARDRPPYRSRTPRSPKRCPTALIRYSLAAFTSSAVRDSPSVA